MNEKRMQALFLRDFSLFLEQKRRMAAEKPGRAVPVRLFGRGCLSDEIRHGAAGILRVPDAGGLAGLDALEQPGHVPAQFPHHGAALFVLQDLSGVGAVDHGPIGAVDQRHVEELTSWSSVVVVPPRRAEQQMAAGL